MPLDPHVCGAPVLLRYLPDGPLVGAEVGVLRGVGAEHLLVNRPELTLLLVDHWQHGGLVKESPEEIKSQAHSRLSRFGNRVWWLELDSIVAATTTVRASLDFAYLDSAHTFKHLAVEIEHWQHTIKPGGILAGHDYGHPDYPGVEAAVTLKAAEFGWSVHVEERTWLVRL